MYQRAKFLPAGDKALAVELGDSISVNINRKVLSLLAAIENQEIPGIIDLVPSYRSLLVYYDPLCLSLSQLEKRLSGLTLNLDRPVARAPKVLEIPTVYGGEYGPDLPHVADHNGLTIEEVVRIHSTVDYLVYMMGFTPGFPYLGGMSDSIATPRLQTPRTLIPTGSVGIAEEQTGIYPIESPGGWQLIGRTPVQFFDHRKAPPVVVEPGDFIRFVPVTATTYQVIQQQVQLGTYRLITKKKPGTF